MKALTPTLGWPHRQSRDPRGFTLIEILIALSIIALVGAVAIPMLAHRLNTTLVEADLSQLETSLRGLSPRLATLGVELTLDRAGLKAKLPDGRPPLDLPAGWTVTSERPPMFGRGGFCSAGSLLVDAPPAGRRWRAVFGTGSCTVQFQELPP